MNAVVFNFWVQWKWYVVWLFCVSIFFRSQQQIIKRDPRAHRQKWRLKLIIAAVNNCLLSHGGDDIKDLCLNMS